MSGKIVVVAASNSYKLPAKSSKLEVTLVSSQWLEDKHRGEDAEPQNYGFNLANKTLMVFSLSQKDPDAVFWTQTTEKLIKANLGKLADKP